MRRKRNSYFKSSNLGMELIAPFLVTVMELALLAKRMASKTSLPLLNPVTQA